MVQFVWFFDVSLADDHLFYFHEFMNSVKSFRVFTVASDFTSVARRVTAHPNREILFLKCFSGIISQKRRLSRTYEEFLFFALLSVDFFICCRNLIYLIYFLIIFFSFEVSASEKCEFFDESRWDEWLESFWRNFIQSIIHHSHDQERSFILKIITSESCSLHSFFEIHDIKGFCELYMILRSEIEFLDFSPFIDFHIFIFMFSDRSIRRGDRRNFYHEIHICSLDFSQFAFEQCNFIFDFLSFFYGFRGRLSWFCQLSDLISFCPQDFNLLKQNSSFVIDWNEQVYIDFQVFLRSGKLNLFSILANESYI
ncbi:MAG: hypothetical protein ACD_2C00211G0001 [uncultured bacterium (gcode 4)]|uniref:Uncharacterized protein n=1 Tax=uncultured bacterium (gcode 4) TaxID=1234023 RepID=K2G4D7_9BACT|nr:MAG: hypothetical protein ACD_2C00211G0001 [uncultured bacterium (gcode 4)]